MRLAQRLAAGLPPARAAAAERLPEAEVEALAAEPAFERLVAACRRLDGMPEAERVERLLKLAMSLLERAVREGDVRAAVFVFRACERGRHPGRVLAEGVVRAQARAARPPAEPAPPAAPAPAAPTRPRDPVARAAAGTAARLRRDLAREEVLHEAAAPQRPAKAARPVRIPTFLERSLGCSTAAIAWRASDRHAAFPARSPPAAGPEPSPLP